MQTSDPLESGLLAKKGRPTTSCTECFRRKQKCDRNTPCNHCSARNVGDRCSYTRSPDYTIVSKKPRTGPHMSLDDKAELANNQPHWQKPVQHSSHLGYSSVAGSNAFVELERVFEDGNEYQSIHAAHNGPPTPPSQLCTRAKLLISRLPPKHIIEGLTATFFLDANWHYFILEELYFNDLYSHWYGTDTSPLPYLSSDGSSQELRYFPALLFQVLALSLQFISPESVAWGFFGGVSSVSKNYSDTGVELLELLEEHDTALTAVQASLLRASWLKNLGRGVHAWRSLGNAIRLSQELGLHRPQYLKQSSSNSVEDSLATFWYNDYKKRVWINLYTWDSLMAMVLGRPMMISDCDCDTQIPIDCDIPTSPSRTVPMTLSNTSDRNAPSSLSASLVRYFISTKVHTIRELRLDSPHPKDYSQVGVLHEQVLAILDNTKPVLRHESPDTSWDSQYLYLPQQREEILTVTYTFLTALHRPHISTHVQSRRAVLQATLVVLDSQQRLFELTQPHHYMLFYLSFYTVDAAILLSVVTALYPSQVFGDMDNVHRALQQSVIRLAIMAPFNPTAKSGLDVVQRCYQKLRESCQSSLSPGMIPSHPSSMGLQLQDIHNEGTHERQDYSECVPDEPGLSAGNFIQDFSTTDGSSATHYFDQSYWLNQIDGIYSAVANVSDLDTSLPPSLD